MCPVTIGTAVGGAAISSAGSAAAASLGMSVIGTAASVATQGYNMYQQSEHQDAMEKHRENEIKANQAAARQAANAQTIQKNIQDQQTTEQRGQQEMVARQQIAQQRGSQAAAQAEGGVTGISTDMLEQDFLNNEAHWTANLKREAEFAAIDSSYQRQAIDAQKISRGNALAPYTKQAVAPIDIGGAIANVGHGYFRGLALKDP